MKDDGKYCMCRIHDYHVHDIDDYWWIAEVIEMGFVENPHLLFVWRRVNNGSVERYEY